MSKSIYVVGAIGLIGCVALSLMMQHLLKVKGDRARPAMALEIEEELADCLRGPVEVATLEVDGERTLCIRLPVKAGVPGDNLARGASDLLWKRSTSWREQPERLRLEVLPAQGGAPIQLDSHSPALRGMRRKTVPVAPPK